VGREATQPRHAQPLGARPAQTGQRVPLLTQHQHKRDDLEEPGLRLAEALADVWAIQ
jgi:hypothetical protein